MNRDPVTDSGSVADNVPVVSAFCLLLKIEKSCPRSAPVVLASALEMATLPAPPMTNRDPVTDIGETAVRLPDVKFGCFSESNSFSAACTVVAEIVPLAVFVIDAAGWTSDPERPVSAP
jgi:hypothetical protein